MEQIVKTEVIQLFEDSFSGDIFERELRLTEEQTEILKKAYPNIEIAFISESYESSKNWYHVKL